MSLLVLKGVRPWSLTQISCEGPLIDLTQGRIATECIVSWYCIKPEHTKRSCFRFDPDRFSPENIKQLPSLAYQPFGFAGKRKCPGWRFSIAEGLVFLSVLIRRFKFHLVEGQKVKPVHRLVTSPAEEIWVTVTTR